MVGYSAILQSHRISVSLKDTDKDRVNTVILERWDALSNYQDTLLHIFGSQGPILRCCHCVLDPMVTSLLMFNVRRVWPYTASHTAFFFYLFILPRVPLL